KRLGVSDRQAVIIGHNDTDHRHVHIMVNRVCPITGKAATMSNDQLKLSDWAHDYREKRGELHFCPARDENRKKRKDGFHKDQSMSPQEWRAWKKSQTKDIWDSFRADRAKAKDSRKGQYDALWDRREAMFAERREEIKAVFKPRWRDLFKQQRTDLKNFDAGFFDRLGFALSRSKRNKIVGTLLALTNDGELRAEFIRQQEQAKKQLGNEHKARVRDASRQIHRLWQIDRDDLKAMHAEQDQRAYEATKAKSAEIWQEPAPEQSKPDFEKNADRRDKAKKPKRRSFEAFFGGDEKAITKARETQKKERAKNRKRNRTRKRDRDDGGREFDM
ncbi:relaxase/mobilization nuclease domain-containing protein, partial [Tateyamaria sp. syn59]|uniref:relaxase/mobilization nuclease domain-containing protein n=1 Tax=Tateyamaria sp. syn59 TaxID=2576942 RepID=UPI0011BF4024